MTNNIDIRLIERAFFDSLKQHSITPYDDDFSPEFDGILHRFRLEGDSNGAKSGAYKAFADQWPHWYIQDYHKGNQMIHVIFSKEYIPAEDRLAYVKNEGGYSEPIRTADRLKAEQERQQRQKEKQALDAETEKAAILRAWQEYMYQEHTHLNSSAVHSGKDHPYLQAKHIDYCPYYFGLRVKKTYQPEHGHVARIGELLVPIVDCVTREFRSFQHINTYKGNTFKGFYPRISIKACCCELFPYEVRQYVDITPEQFRCDCVKGQPHSNRYEADTLFICEGLATGLSVLEILRISGHKAGVTCALSCGNISNIARIWRERNPKLRIIIAADNDASHAGENAAIDTIKAGFADDYTMPPVEGCDWNDRLIQLKGDIA